MSAFNRLSELFSEFPGIGPRQAKRFVYFLLTQQPTFLSELSRHITDIKKEIHVCDSCFRFFPKDSSGSSTCQICRDPKRNKTLLAIVSLDVDLENIEKSRTFDGVYFVLGGTVPILEKDPAKKVRSRELLQRINELATDSKLKEIIIATSFNSEGENTADYIKSLLSKPAAEHSLKISVLGRGLSTGTELEYSDNETIKNAIRNRQ